MNNKINRLSRVTSSFMLLLFAVCLTVNGIFCSNYNLYEVFDKTAVYEMWTSSESIAADENGDNDAHFMSSSLEKNNSDTEAITKNICPTLMVAAIPEGFSLLFFLIAFLYFFLTSFIFLPDRWTLINQKVRMDN